MDHYHYLPLDTQKLELRLFRLRKGDSVKIEGDVTHIPISDHDNISYEAVSYTWGDTELTETIEVGGKRLWITESLHSALHCLRFPDRDRDLWIDAICINQIDEEERSQQVLEMRKIFASAKNVIFWLGKPTAAVMLLMDSLAELQRAFHKLQERSTASSQDNSNVESSMWKTLWSTIRPAVNDKNGDLLAQQQEGLRVLLRRPWFQRVWVLQEVANAPSAVVCSGRCSVSAEVFAQSPLLLGLTPEPQVQSVLDLMPKSTPAALSEGRGQDYLINLMLKFSACKATDERDMIFALLGMTLDPSNHVLLRPDYTTTMRKVLYNTVSYWLESGTAISQIVECLSSIRTVHTTYLVPFKRTKTAQEMMRTSKLSGKSPVTVWRLLTIS